MNLKIWEAEYTAEFKTKEAAADLARVWDDASSMADPMEFLSTGRRRRDARRYYVVPIALPGEPVYNAALDEIDRAISGEGKYRLSLIEGVGGYAIGVVKRCHFTSIYTDDEMQAAETAAKDHGFYESVTVAGHTGYAARRKKSHKNLNSLSRRQRIEATYVGMEEAQASFKAYAKRNQYGEEQFVLGREAYRWELVDPATGDAIKEFEASDLTEAMAVYLAVVKPDAWMAFVKAEQPKPVESAFERAAGICESLDDPDIPVGDKLWAVEALSTFALVREVNLQLLKKAAGWLWDYHMFQVRKSPGAIARTIKAVSGLLTDGKEGV